MTLTVLGTTTSVLLGDGENYWLRTKEEKRKREMFGDCKKESQRLRGESKDYARNVRTIGGFFMKSLSSSHAELTKVVAVYVNSSETLN